MNNTTLTKEQLLNADNSFYFGGTLALAKDIAKDGGDENVIQFLAGLATRLVQLESEKRRNTQLIQSLTEDAEQQVEQEEIVEVNGELYEPSGYAKAVILHALDRFVNEDCELPEGCQHFNGYPKPTVENVLDLIDTIENDEFFLYVDKAEENVTDSETETEEDVTEITAFPSDAEIKAFVDEQTNATRAKAVQVAYGSDSQKVRFFEEQFGAPLTKELIDANMVQYRAALNRLKNAHETGSPDGLSISDLMFNRAIGNQIANGAISDVNTTVEETRQALYSLIGA